MNQSQAQRSWNTRTTGAIVGGLLGSALCGCSVQRAEQPKPAPRVAVSPEAFAASDSSRDLPAAEQPEPDENAQRIANREVVEIRPLPAGERPAPAPVAPEGLALIEAKVGDINGKPIYISTFFEPIEARLLAEAEQKPLNAWRGAAMGIIDERLSGMIMDELLRAEALAALNEQQRQGLRAFLSNFRRNILTENLGSAQLAEKRGQSVDDALREKEIETLVGLTLFQEVNKRVHVSWRDIQQRYEQRFDDFNPPPTAVFRLLRVRTDEAEAIEQVAARLAADDPFDAIASEPWNTFDPEDGGLVRSAFDGRFDEGSFFGSDILNEQARSLEPGGVAGPFELGSYTCWLKLEDIERQSISLYDAQLTLNTQLTQERRTEARNEYFERLFERARVSNRPEILRRLLEIAEERYGPR